MKNALIIGISVFLLTMLINPLCFAQKGGKKGKGPPPPTHEEFVYMYDRDGNGEVSMDEFLEGPVNPRPAGKKGPPPGGKKGPK